MGTNVSKHVAEENLIAAAEVGHLLGIMEAIGAGADVNARTADAHLLSALHYACKGVSSFDSELVC